MGSSRVLYLDPFSGIAGDMFSGLLIDLGADVAKLREEFDKLDIEYDLRVKRVNKKGITATSVNVIVPEEKRHQEVHLSDIYKTLDRLDESLSQRTKRIFEKLVAVEGKIHGLPKEKVHLHEAGAIDAIIEIVGAVKGLELLKVERVCCGLVNTGTGFISIEHGRYPVPAPATAELLKGIPIHVDSIGGIRSELVTLTGALILSELVDEFGPVTLTVEKVGYGAGDRDLEIPNVLRGYLGFLAGEAKETKKIALIETNIDDMNPQIYGYIMETLFDKGAVDVFYTPVYMKKNRPGVKVSVMCPANKVDEITKALMEETTTIGVRISYPERLEAQREVREVETEYGRAMVKIAQYGSEIVKISPEYESCKKIAEKTGKPLRVIYNLVYEKAEESLVNKSM